MNIRPRHRLATLCAALLLPLSVSAGELIVSAAASLTNAFKEIGQGFEAAHPDAKVTMNFAASGALLQQISQGAPVDVFASADQETMNRAADGGHVLDGTRVNFAGNQLVVVTPADSKVKMEKLSDLKADEVKRIAIGNPSSVPNGRYAKSALEVAKLWASLEPKLVLADNVRQSLNYVSRGEVEVGFVFATDAATDKEHVKVAFSVPLEKPIVYPIAQIKTTQNAELGKSFIEYVRSPAGIAVLERYGFTKP